MAKKNNPVAKTTFAAIKDLVEKELASRGEALPDIPTVNVNLESPPVSTANARVGTTGQYRGAPAGVTSPQRLGNMRSGLLDMLNEGMPGRSWYDQSSQAARDLTGNREGLTQLYGLMNAATSAGASVPTNQGFGVKGYNQFITGSDINSGRFPGMVANIAEGIKSGEVTMGPKVGPFYEAVTVPEGGQATRPTNDIWMARAFGYKDAEGKDWDQGLGTAQHRFMDAEMNRLTEMANKQQLGGFSDWTPEKVQAAIWTSIKARTENTPISDAAYDFSNDLDRLTANINVESEPAMGLNHLQNIRNIPDAAQALQEAQRSVLSDPQGRDLIALNANALTRPTETGFGYYKGYSAPTDVVQVLASQGTGSNALDPASAGLLDAISAAHGLARGQESVGNNFFRSTGVKAKERNAADIDVGGPLPQDKMSALGEKLDATFGGAVFPVNTKNGVRLMSDQDSLKEWAKSQGIDPENADAVGKAWQKETNAIIKSELNAKPTWGFTSGNLVGSFEQYTPSAYLKSIDASGVSEGIDRALQQLAPQLDKVDEIIIQQYPDVGQSSEVMTLVRQTLAQEGLGGVRRLVEMGILPVAVLGVLAQEQSAPSRDRASQTGGLISEL